MSSLEDHHVKKKPQDSAETNKYYQYAKECLNSLYKYSLGSFIHPKRCPCVISHKCTCTYSQSKKDTDLESIEMGDYLESKSNAEINRIQERKESEYRIIEAINRHYQSHLKKWSERQKFPWKIVLHLLLVVLVTVQVS